jgi:succinyl-diaminopimelate desuccinylase
VLGSCDVVNQLGELIACPSSNPPGDTKRVAEVVATRMAEHGFRAALHAPPEAPEMVSVITESGEGHPCVLFHAHLDTVPPAAPDQWISDPFTARMKDGRVFGLGACDDKGPLAAMMVAAQRIAERRQTGRIVVVGAADEEAAGVRGTAWLREHGAFMETDFAVIGEQTHNRIALCHKGTVRLVVAIRGRSAHATQPDRGVNAIHAMAELIRDIEQYHQILACHPHPLLGAGTASVNLIAGGRAGNVVADDCEATIDRRIVPPDKPTQVIEQIRDLLRGVERRRGVSAEVLSAEISPWFQAPGGDPMTQRFMEVIQSITGHDPGPVGYPPGSDAKFFMPLLSRIPTIVFGPGSHEQAHAVDEWVSVEELNECMRVLEVFGTSVLGGACGHA